MATRFETAIMRLLIEQDMYKEGESDTFKTPNKWEIKVERIEEGWVLSERNNSKAPFNVVALHTDLSRLIRYHIFRRHFISY